MVVMILWLAVMIGAGGWWVWQDRLAYARFQTLGDTAERQRVYLRWIVQSFAILVGASVVSLWLAGGLVPFDGFPAAFEPLHLGSLPSPAPRAVHFLPLLAGLGIGVGISVAVQWWRMRKLLTHEAATDALLPRNRNEAALALLLSINAGFSEELLFRLALPLLLFQLTHAAMLSMALSILCFGLAHAYQGWKGILGTMAAGALLTLYYCTHGSLVRVMVAHALIDVIALLVRPALVDLFARRRAPRWLALAH